MVLQIHLGFKHDIESIKVYERNLEMIKDRKTGIAYDVRFTYPIEIAIVAKYFGARMNIAKSGWTWFV